MADFCDQITHLYLIEGGVLDFQLRGINLMDIFSKIVVIDPEYIVDITKDIAKLDRFLKGVYLKGTFTFT